MNALDRFDVTAECGEECRIYLAIAIVRIDGLETIRCRGDE